MNWDPASKRTLMPMRSIDESTLDEDAKIIEKECVLQARKKAFGDDFKYYPPWRKF